MPSPFSVTAATNSISLDTERHGEVPFTVFNASGRPIRGRARPVPETPEAGAWLSLAGAAERDFPIAGTEQYTMHITVPNDAPPGSYTFHLDMTGVENPDELFTQGPTVTFVVPEPAPPKKKFPWWILLVVFGGLVVCAGLAVAGWIIFKPDDEPTPTPEATVAATSIPEAVPTSTPTPAPTPTPFGGGTGRVSFVRGTASGGDILQADADIYTMAIDDPEPIRLTFNKELIGYPDWSPDGQQLAFVRQSGLDFDIFVMNADGTDLENLTSDHETLDAEPAWSPDGTRIAFSSDRAGGITPTVQIYVMDADGSNVRQLTDPTEKNNASPDWSPDGERIVFSSNRSGKFDIYTMRADDGGSLTRLTDNGSSFGPNWSPDGEQIVFYRLEAGSAGIWVVNSNGMGDPKQLLNEGILPRWSPDGTKIIFASASGGNFDLYVINADGSGKQQITDTPEQDVFPAWESRPAP